MAQLRLSKNFYPFISRYSCLFIRKKKLTLVNQMKHLMLKVMLRLYGLAFHAIGSYQRLVRDYRSCVLNMIILSKDYVRLLFIVFYAAVLVILGCMVSTEACGSSPSLIFPFSKV